VTSSRQASALAGDGCLCHNGERAARWPRRDAESRGRPPTVASRSFAPSARRRTASRCSGRSRIAVPRRALLALALLALLTATRPSEASFALRARRLPGLGLGARRYADRVLFATARHAGRLHLGALGAWVGPVPSPVEPFLDLSDPTADVRLFALASVAVHLLLWRSTVAATREWTWRHLACPPASPRLFIAPGACVAPFASLLSGSNPRALAASLITFLAVAPDAQTILGRGPAAALFLVGGAVANLVGATVVERLGIRPGPGPGLGLGNEYRYTPPPWAPRTYASGADGGLCALLGCLAAVSREGGGWRGGLFAGFARSKVVTHALFGGAFEASSTSLLWVTLAGRALGGLGDVGVWTCGVGAAVGWYARTWGVV
jgi:hypothetical protein